MSTSAIPNKQLGFTLIELLVVLAIMSLLAAIALPALGARHPGIERRQLIAKIEGVFETSRTGAMMKGSNVVVDFASIDPKLRYSSAKGAGEGSLTFYPDGSTSGGVVSLDEKPLLAIDWLTGAPSEIG